MQHINQKTPIQNVPKAHISQIKSRNKIQKFRIDKNLILRLHQIQKRSKIVFDGTILYSNGLELSLSPNYWKLISDYHKIETESLLYVYNFDSHTINVKSSLDFNANFSPQEIDIQIIVTLIKRDLVIFSQKLYRFGMINAKSKFFFEQNLGEMKLNKKILDQYNSSLPNQDKSQSMQAQPQNIVRDKNQLQHTSPHILVCPIQPIKRQVRPSDLPMDLQYGPKSIKYHFTNGVELNQIKGGFFQLQKVFVSVIKNLQKFHQQSIYQNSTHKLSQAQPYYQKRYVQTNILVRKSLKAERQQSKINRLKILKQLVIVQQIKNRKHLIQYYLNSEIKNFEPLFNSSDQKPSKEEIESLSNSLSSLDINQKVSKQKSTQSIELTDVYMDFHPHTLDDFIKFEHNTVDSKIKMCLQMIESVIAIHKSYVIHRDLKPENALIDFTTDRFNPTLKLIDFSESAIFISSTKRFQNPTIPKHLIREIFQMHSSRFYAATVPYSPPQCQLNRQNRTSKGVNSFEIDCWSLGIILFQIVMGKKLLNCFKPYEEDVMKVIKEVGFENYFSKSKKRGFGILENVIQLIALKNVVCDQSKRMDTMRCHNLLNSTFHQLNQWTTDFTIQSRNKTTVTTTQ